MEFVSIYRWERKERERMTRLQAKNVQGLEESTVAENARGR
jgi:hypothetical protein